MRRTSVKSRLSTTYALKKNDPDRLLGGIGMGMAPHLVADVYCRNLSDETLLNIERTLAEGHKEGTWGELFKPHLRRVLAMDMVLAVFQQWCGINVIFNYANDIFKEAGYNVSGILFNLLIVGITNLIFTFVAMGLIDRVGRKILLLYGSAGLALCYIGVGLCFHLNLVAISRECIEAACFGKEP